MYTPPPLSTLELIILYHNECSMPAQPKNIQYWASLPNHQQHAVLAKWQDLARLDRAPRTTSSGGAKTDDIR